MARGEGVKKISDLFETYRKRLRAPESSVAQEFCNVVNETIGIQLALKNVSYKPTTRTLLLKVPGQIKTEILMRKDEILIHMKGRLGEQNAPHDVI